GDGPAAEHATPTVAMAARPAAAERVDPLAFGVIGAGRFAQGILLPSLAAQAGVRIAAIATAQVMTAHHVGKKYESAVCSSDYREVLARPDVGSVGVATRHAS